MATVRGLLEEIIRSEVLDAADVARVLGGSPQSVRRWMSTGAVPRRETQQRLLELKAVVDLLRDVLRDEPARLWLRRPNPTLDGQEPIDLIEHG